MLFILSQLSDDDVDWIARTGERCRLTPGTRLVTQGDPIDAVHLVLDVKVGVSLDKVGDTPAAILATLGAGEIVGEMSLMDSNQHSRPRSPP